MAKLSELVMIPWNGHTKAFHRDHLQTAYLHYLDALNAGLTGDDAAIRVAVMLRDDDTIPHTMTITLALAARVCHQRGIEL